MPKFDLLLLPLIGGYIFLITFTVTKLYHQRIERQRLIFNSVIAGLFLSILGFCIDAILFQQFGFLLKMRSYAAQLIPFEHAGINQSIGIFLLSYPLARFANLIYSKKKALKYVVEKWGTPQEKFFWNSLNAKQDADKLVMLTTKNNKVYIAYINKISEPIGHSFVSLIPNISGYRDKETQELIITTNYLPILKRIIEEGKKSEIDDKFGIIIPLSEIQMVSKFDFNIFGEFQSPNILHESQNKSDSGHSENQDET